MYGQKQQFHEVGFLVVSGVVPRPLVDAALRDINLSLSNGFAPEQRAHYDATTWCADMVTSPSILDLIYRTPALALAMSLTGGVARINEASIQIRVRLPFFVLYSVLISVFKFWVKFQLTMCAISSLATVALVARTIAFEGSFPRRPRSTRLFPIRIGISNGRLTI